MRLEPLEVWEFTAGGAVRTAIPLAISGLSATIMLLSGDTSPAITIGAGVVGAGVGAYLALDWLGRASELVDAHRRREIEMQPDMLRQRNERDLVEAKITLVRAIGELTGEHLTYAREVLNSSSLVLDGDGDRVAWRIDGQEFPVAYATVWLTELAKCQRDQLPADAAWSSDMGLSREAWRAVASAMSAALAGQGVAKRAQGGPIPPRWTADDSRVREAALIRTQVLLAAELDRQIRFGEAA